jgi:hypothetical protein
VKRIILTISLLFSVAYGQSGFFNGMVVLDTTTITTSAGKNNDINIKGSLILVTPSGNLTDTITGMDIGQNVGGLILVVNTSATYNLVIENNSSSSTLTNRVLTADGNNYILPPFNTAIVGYDVVGSMWHIIRVPDVPLGSYQATPADPSGTTSGTGVMMGLAGSFTPTKSGKVMIVISANISNNTIGDGAQAQIRYGTSTAPTNGAALTGTTAGNLAKITNPLLALLTPGTGNITCNAIISGLSLGTSYWFDLSLARIIGGTASLSGISISIIEL